MRSADLKIIGFRLRSEAGAKWAVLGSKAGLFVPDGVGTDGPIDTLVVAEGPTDAAALLDVGFDVVGRPSCKGQERAVVAICRWIRPSVVAIMADGDGPGLTGAELLAADLAKAGHSVKIVCPPHSADARAWINEGATADTIGQLIDNAHILRLDMTADRF